MRRILTALGVLALLAVPRPSSAGDVMALATWPRPDADWARSYGVAVTSKWFGLVLLEGEGARLRGADEETTMGSLTGSILAAPSLGLFTPYAGLGLGVFRQTRGDLADNGTLRAVVAGLRVRIGPLAVVKGEYRSLSLSGDPLQAVDRRLTVGAGISF